MTLSEFKAWFEGFSEGIDTAPTEAQFAKIKAKVALITGTPTSYPVFIERYRTYLDGIWTQPYREPYVRYASNNGGVMNLNAVGRNDGVGVCNAETASAASSEGTVFGGYSDGVHRGPLIGEQFDIHAAMRELGRAEAVN